MSAETLVLVAERIRDSGQRLAQVPGQHLLVGDVVRHLAQAVHVVGETEEARGNVRQALKGAANHGGAHHLAEGSDVRQAGGAIARLEEHVALVWRLPVQALEKLAGLLERPGLCRSSKLTFGRHLFAFPIRRAGKLGRARAAVNAA